MKVTPDWVRTQIATIEAEKDDAEVAHSKEDWLHQTVLQAIADGKCENPQECARLALTTENIEFERWCA